MGEREGRRRFLENRLGIAGNILPWALMIRDNPERLAYILHRITGLILIIYLPAHIFVTSMTVNPQKWEQFLQLEENPLARFFLWILFGSIVYHGLNGIRLLLVEGLGRGIGKPAPPKPPYKPTSLSSSQRKWLYAVFAAWLVIWIVGGFILFREFGWI